MSNQCYFDGEFYQAIVATNAGDSPATAPTKWTRIPILKAWRRVLARFTYARLLEFDGQTDKAIFVRAAAEKLLEEMVREAANREAWRERPQVR